MSEISTLRIPGEGPQEIVAQLHLQEIPNLQLAIEVGRRLLGLIVVMVKGLLMVLNFVVGVISRLLEGRRGLHLRSLRDRREE